FLCNLPKNLTTHLTHKLYPVFPEHVPRFHNLCDCLGKYVHGQYRTKKSALVRTDFSVFHSGMWKAHGNPA
ncbi:MAG: hypothetical protein ACLTYC_11885, partial [Ruminococcus callidus]|uniref:hypothetical protein n=1 Tax=Ruminococcus callidus TaxID=40519 RepID=UPI0039926301